MIEGVNHVAAFIRESINWVKIYSMSFLLIYSGLSGLAIISLTRVIVACLSTTRFSRCTFAPIVTPGRTIQFFTTAPFLIWHPRPTTQFSSVPSIRQPLETSDDFTLAVSKYCVGQESLVRVWIGHELETKLAAVL